MIAKEVVVVGCDIGIGFSNVEFLTQITHDDFAREGLEDRFLSARVGCRAASLRTFCGLLLLAIVRELLGSSSNCRASVICSVESHPCRGRDLGEFPCRGIRQFIPFLLPQKVLHVVSDSSFENVPFDGILQVLGFPSPGIELPVLCEGG